MTASAGYSGAIILPSLPSVGFTDDPLSNPSNDKQTFVESISAHRYWDNTVVPVIQAELDEVQTVTITGGPTGGTFTLTWGAQTTVNIAYNATAATVQTALGNLSSILPGNVAVSGVAGGPWTVEFIGTLGYASQVLIFGNGAGLTGGTSPGVAIARLQAGQAYTTVSSANYTVHYPGGVIVMTAPYLGANIGVKAHSGSYMPWAVLANVTQWQFDGQTNFGENTSIQGDGNGGLQAGAGYKTFQPLLLEGTFMVTKWWVPESQAGFAADITAGTLFIISGVFLSGNRYEGYVYAKKASIKSDVQKLTDESLDFQVSGQFYLI